MRILYIYRNKNSGFSIGRVFAPIEEEMRLLSEVESIYVPRYRASILDIFTNIKYVRQVLRKNTYDIVHITGDIHYLALFLNKKKVVVTVHDIGYYTNVRFSLHKLLRYLFWLFPLKYVTKVTFVSEKSCKEFNSVLSLQKDRYEIIPNPVQKQFIFTPKSLNKDCPIILHVGTQPHKNLIGIINAIKDINCSLCIIGKLNEEQIKLLYKYKIKFENLYKISDEELLSTYKKCDIVSFPTFYEGFGMPIIEAQAIGRPVVTSNISPMNSIAGINAILVEPSNFDSIKEGLLRAINEYDKIVEAGVINSRKYIVSTIANKYFKLYNKIIDEVR